MASSPVFISGGFAVPAVSVTAVSTDRTGAGSYTTIIAGAPSIVKGIEFHAVTLTIDTMLLLFYDDAANVKLLDEIKITAATPTNTTSGWRYLWRPPEGILYLPSGDEIQAAMYSGSATIHARALGGIV